MKILQICSKIPFSPKDGGGIAMNILTHGLMDQGNLVHVLAVNTPKHFLKDDAIDADYKKATAYQSVFIDTSVKPLAAVLNLFSSKSYNVIRFYSPAFEKVLIEKLKSEQYDIIQLESLWVTPYLEVIRKHSKAKIVLRSHNVEYMIWERLASEATSSFKKIYLNLLAKRLKKYELNLLNQYDAIACITELDATVFKNAGCKLSLIHIPFGIDLEKYKIDDSDLEKPSVFHIGAMDWQPNIDGVNWFLNNVWEKVVALHPSLKLYLAGRSISSDFKQTNVVVDGEVADAHRYISSKSIMIIPLSSGGGMRVKIIEGMALGKTIVSTSIGAEGIEYENKKNILIADSSSEFIDAIDKCINDSGFADTLGKNARTLVETKYNNKLICNKLSDFYRSLLN